MGGQELSRVVFSRLRMSTRVWLILLSVAALIPIIAFAAFSVHEIANTLTVAEQRRVVERSEALSSNVDREVRGILAMADAMAASPYLAEGKLPEFYTYAVDSLRGKQANVLLFDTAMRQLLNTRVAFGTPLPKPTTPEEFQRVIESRRAEVSDLLFGRVAKQVVFNVAVPVLASGAVRYVLVVTAEPSRIGELLEEQKFNGGWYGAVIDGKGQFIATNYPDRARLDFSPFKELPLAAGQSSTVTAEIDGATAFLSKVRSPLTGWSSIVWAPQEVLAAPINAMWKVLVGASLLAISASAILASVFSLPFTHLIRHTLESVRHLGSGKPLPPLGGFLEEGLRIEQSLAEANRKLLARQRESEEGRALLSVLLENVPEGITIVGGPDLKVIANSKRAVEWIGRPAADLNVGANDHAEAFCIRMPDGSMPLMEQLPLYRASRHGEKIADEQYLVVRPDGKTLRIEVRVNPVRDSDGAILGAISCWRDVTERYDAAREIARNEQRLRLALSVAQMAIIDREIDPGSIVRVVNDSEVLGLKLDGVLFEQWIEGFLAAVHPGDRARVEENQRRAPSTLGPFTYDFRVSRSDGQTAWIEAKGETLAGDAGAPKRILETLTDITVRKQLEQNFRLISRELTHRAKNLLTVIVGIATQTARSNVSLEDFITSFSHRIQGLAASHDLLLQSDWAGAPLGELVAAQLAPFGGVDGKRVRANGPRILLKNDVLQNLGMAFHELATNAVKYGALSKASGSVDIAWRIVSRESKPQLQLTWTERGGPILSPARRKGFGQAITVRLLARVVAGEAKIEFGRKGIVWTVNAPLDAVVLDQSPPFPNNGINPQ